MNCPHCNKAIDGYRGKFSIDTTCTILSMYYVKKKTVYAIVKYLKEQQVKSNKMTIKKTVDSYEYSWNEFLKRNKEEVL